MKRSDELVRKAAPEAKIRKAVKNHVKTENIIDTIDELDLSDAAYPDPKEALGKDTFAYQEERPGALSKLQQWAEKAPARVIFSGFSIIVLIGSLLLSLPFASREGVSVKYIDCLFTSASAACVTGLVRFDTWQTWSLFGQIVILGLIQIGGVGFMSIIMMLLVASGKKISFRYRKMMNDSIGSGSASGAVRMASFILKGTAAAEGIGAALLLPFFIPRAGVLHGIWYSIFHSVSAFCNAGFDLMGRNAPGSSLITAADDWYFNIVIMLLIITGGLGFFVWGDLIKTRFSLKKLRLHSKIVLAASAVLIFGGAAVIFICETVSGNTSGCSLSHSILTSLFQSVTMRTAGFSTLPLGSMSQASLIFMIMLMMIGGNAGSTAGGMKTTTMALLILNIRAVMKKRKNVEVFSRRISHETMNNAAAIAFMYALTAIAAAAVISLIEGYPILTSLFETASAVATVGSTLGVTDILSTPSEVIIILLMLAGRCGSLTILLLFSRKDKFISSQYPEEEVRVG